MAMDGVRLLDNIDSPADVKKLDIRNMERLASEIRDFLAANLSKTGGHLASNLGVVELTLALHKVFDSPVDKIIWDVGHQVYIHKIITGRRDVFGTLRRKSGISGFPKADESCHDCFNTGHSSTSISAALGMARARDLTGGNHYVVAVIGDGAMTGGMAFEALNDAGHSKNNIIVILNDNGMSISKNTGALAGYLRKLRMRPAYTKVKGKFDSFMRRIPGAGEWILKWLDKFKDSFKQMVLPGMLFEELGFKYFGPVDGHNLGDLVGVLTSAKHISGPLLVHICTTKGKGLKFAEEKPNTYHSISCFDPETGKLTETNGESFSAVFSKAMAEIGSKDSRIVGITAAMIDGTGMEAFSRLHPERVFDVGIAEQHAVTMAAGMAARGMVPVVSIYSSFLQRAYDQILHDVAMQGLHVVFAVDRAGITGEDGETHHGVFDFSFLRHIPGIVIAAPADYRELTAMLEYAIFKHKGPIVIRYPKGRGCRELTGVFQEISLGKGCLLEHGTDVTIAATGAVAEAALKAGKLLGEERISAEVINARFVKPLDSDLIIASVKKTGRIVCVEDNVTAGGFGCAVLEMLSLNGVNVESLLIGYPDKYITHGTRQEILKEYGLGEESICRSVSAFLRGGSRSG